MFGNQLNQTLRLLTLSVFLLFTFTIELIAQQPSAGSNSLILQPNSSIGKDAFVHGLTGYRSTNFGSDEQLPTHAGTYNGTPLIARSFIAFDLSYIPSGMAIDSAFLSLYAFDVPNTRLGTHRNSSGPNGIWVRKVTSAWNEATITWNNAPSTTATNQVALAPSTSSMQDYLGIDVTALINDLYQNPSTDFGLQTILQNENYYRSLNFYSSDAVDSLKRPKLEIHYSPLTTSLVNNVSSTSNFFIYPNPSKGFIQLNFYEARENYQVSILDLKGKTIKQIDNYKNEQQIATDFLSSGVYFVRISGKNATSVKKFIVQ